MLHGKVLRAPGYGSKLASLDAGKAEQIGGVRVVRDGDFAGAIGPDTETAARAIAAMQADWKSEPHPSSKELFEYLKSHPEESRPGRRRGSLEAGWTQAAQKCTASYTVAYIAHIPLEPRAAVAEWNDGKLTVWTGTQRPFGVRGELAGAFRLSDDVVRVIVPDTGAGYGGKHTG